VFASGDDGLLCSGGCSEMWQEPLLSRPGPRPAPDEQVMASLAYLLAQASLCRSCLRGQLFVTWSDSGDRLGILLRGLTQGLRRQVVSSVSVFDVRAAACRLT
jgi:hypothetical protein